MSSAALPAASPEAARLKITEVFLSLQGETSLAGWPTVFIRLTGCPLRCQYCDTAYAFHGGQWWSIDALLDDAAKHRVRHVCITGGEPLAQKHCLELLRRLCDAGYVVSLETSGAMDIAGVDPRVIRIVDIKTPGSKEAGRNRWENLALLTPQDQVKFVLCDRADYEWACGIVEKHRLAERSPVLFSPSYEQLPARELADWIVADSLPVRFQLQLHKVLWGSERGR